MGHRDAVRITTAPPSRAQDMAVRQRRYVISMSIRMICFVAAVAVGPGWLRWVLMVGAVFLPYVAVVFANAEDQHDGGLEGLPMHHSRELTGSQGGEDGPAAAD